MPQITQNSHEGQLTTVPESPLSEAVTSHRGVVSMNSLPTQTTDSPRDIYSPTLYEKRRHSRNSSQDNLPGMRRSESLSIQTTGLDTSCIAIMNSDAGGAPNPTLPLSRQRSPSLDSSRGGPLSRSAVRAKNSTRAASSARRSARSSVRESGIHQIFPEVSPAVQDYVKSMESEFALEIGHYAIILREAKQLCLSLHRELKTLYDKMLNMKLQDEANRTRNSSQEEVEHGEEEEKNGTEFGRNISLTHTGMYLEIRSVSTLYLS